MADIEELDEGRGKKGRDRHAEDGYENEWGDHDDKKKKVVKRGGKREMQDEGFVDETGENVEQIDEAGASADQNRGSLTPEGGLAAGVSKAECLATFTNLLAQLGKEDLTGLFAQVQAQFGPDKFPGNNSNEKSNKASLSPNSRPMKEEVEEIFEGEELSEEFKEKASVIFEAIINTRINVELEALREELETIEDDLVEQYNEALEAESKEIFEGLAENINQYLEYAVNEWIDENQVAIENNLRTEIAEGFIGGLHKLFSEHYITVPEDKVDVIAEMKAKIDDLETKLDEAIDENIELRSTLSESAAEIAVEEAVAGLTLAEADKLRSLAEGLEFTDVNTFKRKLTVIKENYFAKKPVDTGLLKEETENKPVIAESVNFYADALKRKSK